MRNIFNILFLIISFELYSQSNSDFILINDYIKNNSGITTTPIVSSKQKTYNPVKIMFNGLLTFYQKILSPQISSSCLYNPSCSRFSRKAINEQGLIKGILLTADRLTRCNYLGAEQTPSFRYNKNGLIDDEPCLYHKHCQ